MNPTFDQLQIVFWGISYVLIILIGIYNITINHNKPSIPYIAVIANFAWEICAINHSNGYWGHVLWFGLDTIIFILNFMLIKNSYSKVLYILSTVLLFSILSILFRGPSGMLLSVFIIDLIMAICFLVSTNHLSPHFKIPIAVTKLLGDTFAGICYGSENIFVFIIAVVVFIINATYLCFCIKERLRLKFKHC